MAWINTAPGDLKTTRADTFRKVKRLEPDMPPTCGCEYLIEYVLKVGPGLNYGMGMVPITFQEISSWTSLNGLELSALESNAMRDLSRAYVGQLNISGKANCPPPWVKGVTDIDTHNALNELKEFSAEAKKANKKPISKKTKRAAR